MSDSAGGAAKPAVANRSLHIAPLDGLRGLAALYVVFHHAHLLAVEYSTAGVLPRSLAIPLKLFAYGRCAVVLFIVLSGFLLMLPVVRSVDKSLRGGFPDYLKRRARRILPPYYAALLLTLLLVALQPLALFARDGLLTSGSVLSHFLMVHNLWAPWNHAINTPMWSVATEWDLYFVFPLLLLPVWRRLGIGALLAAAAVLSVAPQLFVRPFIDWAAPWFILLFALGMAAAAFSCDPSLTAVRRVVLRRGSKVLAVLFIPVFLSCYALKGLIYDRWPVFYHMAADVTFGLHATCLIIYCATQPNSAEQAHGERVAAIVRVAQSPLALWLGRFSYSLYLVHWPLLVLARGWIERLGLGAAGIIAAMLAISFPTIALAYLFYLLFEKPFLVAKQPRESLGPDASAVRSMQRVVPAGTVPAGRPSHSSTVQN